MAKKYNKVKPLVDRSKIYNVKEAIDLAKKTSFVKFDGSIDVAIKLNLDTTKAEQQLRGTISLPNYVGKQARILVISDEINATSAKELGIDLYGTTDMIAKIKDGWFEFDTIITTPKFMPELSKLGKILGPKGLMPNPKLGTVTTNLVTTIKEFKKGKSNYRTDAYGNIHMQIGKVSTDTSKIVENFNALLDFLKSKKPSTVKGEYIQNISINTTMGPGIKVEIAK